MINYVSKPKVLTSNTIKSTDFSFCPSDYHLLKVNYDGKVLRTFVENYKTGKEIGSKYYIKNTNYNFLKTKNIKHGFTLDKQFCETCANVSAIKPFKNSIFIAKDGNGDGLGNVAFYDEGLFDDNDFISSGILNIKINDDYLYYILAILKYSHFKCYIDTKTKQGSTLRHSKLLALDYPIPFNDSLKNEIMEISNIMKKICNNEIEVRKLFFSIDKIIKEELDCSSQTVLTYNTKKADIVNNNCRMDSGMYNESFIKAATCIEKYSNGYFTVDLANIKSGNTPKSRTISESGKYLWVTPTNINTRGIIDTYSKISMNSNNNIKKDSLLIINRGEKYDVGISMFYDYSLYGEGHHNQGIYRIDSYDKETLICMSLYLNSTFCRKLCSHISYGTKMAEMKSADFSKLKFPRFSEEIKKKLVCYYTNKDKQGLLNLEIKNHELKQKMNEKLELLYKKILSESN